MFVGEAHGKLSLTSLKLIFLPVCSKRSQKHTVMLVTSCLLLCEKSNDISKTDRGSRFIWV